MGSDAITSPNLEQMNQISANSARLNSSRVKFETVNYNPYELVKPKGSFFGKILRGLGLLATPFAAVAPAFGPMAPVALAGGLLGSGVAQVGNSMDQRKSMNQIAANQQMAAAPQTMGYPGAGMMSPDATMNVVYSRDQAMGASIQQM